ncbi:NARE ribosyltransferase, partial [Sylvietta virens]|nr:NARE ribosyltransferase [Sylvietta virens]
WPLPTMAPLARALALLAMAVATTANQVLPQDKTLDTFDDQYQGCRPAMIEALPALNRSEFQQNNLFAQVWVKAAAEWQKRGPPVSPLSPDQATAIMAYTMVDLYMEFNNATRTAGSSPRQYRDNFHFKTLHFLLTDALATLRDAQAGHCLDVFLQDCEGLSEAKDGDTVRFVQFSVTSLSKPTQQCPGKEMLFQVHTCHGVEIASFSEQPQHWNVVLIPPFETFKVTEVTQQGNKEVIQLSSSGTYSKYNCEYLKGDATGDSLGDG